jgi:hypothetical protein
MMSVGVLWQRCDLLYAVLCSQGLAVHGSSGQQLTDAALPRDVVSAAFSWAQGAGISCCAFLGDTCATLQLTPQLQELHHR